MKKFHKISAVLLGFAGLLSASSELVQASQPQAQAVSKSEAQAPTNAPAIDPALSVSLTADEQAKVIQAVSDLRSKYGDDLLNHATFKIENGKITLTSTQLDETEMSVSPSSPSSN